MELSEIDKGYVKRVISEQSKVLNSSLNNHIVRSTE